MCGAQPGGPGSLVGGMDIFVFLVAGGKGGGGLGVAVGGDEFGLRMVVGVVSML